MHSNFITPPDLIETVLIVDATQEQIAHCAEVCKTAAKPYNVYFYHVDMNDTNWLLQVINKADIILQSVDSAVPVLKSTRFGTDQILTTPGDYFNK